MSLSTGRKSLAGILLVCIWYALGGAIEEHGSKARRFVEKLSWDNITDEFERVPEDIIQGN